MHELFVQKDSLMRPFFTGFVDETCQLSSTTSDYSSPESRVSNGRVNITDDNEGVSNDDDQTTNNSKLVGKNHSVTSSNERVPNIKRHDYTAISKYYGGRVSHLSIWETLPSVLIFGSISLTCLFCPWARRAYMQMVVFGTAGAYGWLFLRSVC